MGFYGGEEGSTEQKVLLVFFQLMSQEKGQDNVAKIRSLSSIPPHKPYLRDERHVFCNSNTISVPFQYNELNPLPMFQFVDGLKNKKQLP